MGNLDYFLEGEHLESVEIGGALVERYFRGAGTDELVAAWLRDSDGNSTPYLFHHDYLTSVTAVSGHNGGTTQSIRYTAFGQQLSASGSTPNRLKFTGREDDQTGLYYYRARYLDPAIGRFVSEDPLGFQAGINFYAYVGNNPVNANDPSGKDAQISWSGNNVNLNFRYVYTGPGATEVNVARFNSGIQKEWTGTFSTPAPYRSGGDHTTYNATASVTSVISQDPATIAGLTGEGYSKIYVASRFDSNLTQGVRSNMRPPNGNGFWFAGASGWEAAHESGHEANLPDAYSYTTGAPFAGFTNNMMGVYGGSVDARNVAEIVNRAGGGAAGFDVSVHAQQAGFPILPGPVDAGAAGGFLLYPNKPNTNMTRSVYSK